jgi:hypothetical protein
MAEQTGAQALPKPGGDPRRGSSLRAVYYVAAAVLALLVAYGVLTDSLAALWAGVAAAVFSLPVTEGVRSQVSPAQAGQ